MGAKRCLVKILILCAIRTGARSARAPALPRKPERYRQANHTHKARHAARARLCVLPSPDRAACEKETKIVAEANVPSSPLPLERFGATDRAAPLLVRHSGASHWGAKQRFADLQT